MIPLLTCDNERAAGVLDTPPTALTHLSDCGGRQAGVSVSSEQWRPIPGYEGLYDVSDQGRVRSLPRPSTRGGVLRQFVGSHGYVRVNLSRDGHAWATCTHRLVALAFVGPRPEGMDVRHLNGDPTDNRLANLAYGTPSENLRDKVRHGTDHQARKTHCPAGHRYDEANTRVERGRRHCRACDRARAARKRAEAA